MYFLYGAEVAYADGTVLISAGLNIRHLMTDLRNPRRCRRCFTVLDHSASILASGLPAESIGPPEMWERTGAQLSIAMSVYANPSWIGLQLRAHGPYHLQPESSVSGSLIFSVPLGSSSPRQPR